jgi:hypothetical protein
MKYRLWHSAGYTRYLEFDPRLGYVALRAFGWYLSLDWKPLGVALRKGAGR